MRVEFTVFVNFKYCIRSQRDADPGHEQGVSEARDAIFLLLVPLGSS